MSRRPGDPHTLSETLEWNPSPHHHPAFASPDAAQRFTTHPFLPVVESSQTAQQPSRTQPLPAADRSGIHQQPTLLRLPALKPEELPAPPSADLQLIPAPTHSVGRVGAKRFRIQNLPPSRLNLLKFAVMGAVLLAVLTATFAIAGGGRSDHPSFTGASSVAPVSPTAVKDMQIAQNVHPIIQADRNAGYTSSRQHDLFWNSSCSAASFTEVMRAWGRTNVTIGQVIDEMSAHSPPYITTWGGLMSQNAWGYTAELHHFHADVQFQQALSYEEIVRVTTQQGLPVIVGIRDNVGRYYPALGGGHFVVVVGGNSDGLKIVDSSLYRISYLSHDKFIYLWSRGRGLTVLLTPAP
ncbi:MAG TPA: C39 family peptidase [Ktedonobacterales bacterium]|jgi:hypothetical protein